MQEHHVKEIESIAIGLGSLKALLGVSRIDDSEWEHVSTILDDFSFRLRTSASGIREGRNERIPGFGETHTSGKSSMRIRHGCGNP